MDESQRGMECLHLVGSRFLKLNGVNGGKVPKMIKTYVAS